jgi:hypothetical protein
LHTGRDSEAGSQWQVCTQGGAAQERIVGKGSTRPHPPRLTCRHPSHRIFLDRFEAEVGPAAGSVRAYVSAGCLV